MVSSRQTLSEYFTQSPISSRFNSSSSSRRHRDSNFIAAQIPVSKPKTRTWVSRKFLLLPWVAKSQGAYFQAKAQNHTSWAETRNGTHLSQAPATSLRPVSNFAAVFLAWPQHISRLGYLSLLVPPSKEMLPIFAFQSQWQKLTALYSPIPDPVCYPFQSPPPSCLWPHKSSRHCILKMSLLCAGFIIDFSLVFSSF